MNLPLSLPGLGECWLHHLTGLFCPGCGATRALAALLLGDWSGAIGHNVLLTILAPIGLAWACWWFTRRIRKPDFPGPAISTRATLIALATAFSFMILRNLPFAPFDRLAP